FIRLTIAAQAVEQTQQADLLHVFAIERGAGLQGQLTDDALDQRQVLHQPALLFLGREQGRLGAQGGLGGAGRVHGYWASSLLTSRCSKAIRRLRSWISWRSASSSSSCSSGMLRLRTTPSRMPDSRATPELRTTRAHCRSSRLSIFELTCTARSITR